MENVNTPDGPSGIPDTPEEPASPGETEQFTAHVGKQRSRANAYEKRKKALELRLAGATYEQIATRVGYGNKTSAHRAVQDAINQIPKEAAAEVRTQELERLDRIWLRLWTRLSTGDTSVVGQMLRVMDMRAKLTGLYAFSEGSGDNTAVQNMFAGMLAAATAFASTHPEGVKMDDGEEESSDAAGDADPDPQP